MIGLFLLALVLLSSASVIGVRKYHAIDRRDRDRHIAALEHELFPEYFETPALTKASIERELFYGNWDKDSTGAMVLAKRPRAHSPLMTTSYATMTAEVALGPGAVWPVEKSNHVQVLSPPVYL